jgi:hypothetical protein
MQELIMKKTRARSLVQGLTAAVFFLIMVLCCEAGLAAVYHVNAEKGDDANPGTQDKPFRSVRKASDVMQAGDKAIISPGIYHEMIMRGASGKEGAPIVYEGTDGEKVILRGAVRVKDWTKVGSVWIKSGLKPKIPAHAFVCLDDKKLLKKADSRGNMEQGTFFLERTGDYFIRLWNDADPNADHEVDVYEYDFAFNSGDRWNGTAKKWITLRNLTIEKYGRFGISTDSAHPADNSNWELDHITVQYNLQEGIFFCLDDWYVHDCRFVRNAINGCQINGSRVRFVKNYVAENEWYGPSGEAGPGLTIGPDNAHSNIVVNNVFKDNGDPRGYGCAVYLEGRNHDNLIENNLIIGGTHAGVGFYGGSYNKIFNNIFINVAPKNNDVTLAGMFPFRHAGPPPPTQSQGNLIAHNTIWGCPSPVIVLSGETYSPDLKPNRFVNNLFVNCRFLPKMPDYAPVVFSGNAFYSCPEKVSNPISSLMSLKKWLDFKGGKSSTQFPGDDQTSKFVGKDPGLIEPGGNDFHLKPESPLIDAGVPLDEVKTDRDGNPRPHGNGPDIGAYEFTTGAKR